MSRERTGNSLQATALVNEAYLNLVDCKRMQWENRAHFFAVSAQTHAPDFGGPRTASQSETGRGSAARHPGRHGGDWWRSKRKPGRTGRRHAGPRPHRSAQGVGGRAALLWRVEREETAEVLKVSPITVMRD